MADGPGFYLYIDRAGEYRWRLLAANNQIVADSSEGYANRQGALQAVGRIQQLVNDPRLHIHDETRT